MEIIIIKFNFIALIIRYSTNFYGQNIMCQINLHIVHEFIIYVAMHIKLSY